MKAEYMALILCTRKAMWFRKLVKDASCIQNEVTIMMCDNQGSMALANNPINHDRLNHIDATSFY